MRHQHQEKSMTTIEESNTTATDQAQAMERAARELEATRTKHPEWFYRYEEMMPYCAQRAEVVELMHSAPTAFCLGLLYGKFTMRFELAMVTGRPFV
jgi:hypothetical protein